MFRQFIRGVLIIVLPLAAVTFLLLLYTGYLDRLRVLDSFAHGSTIALFGFLLVLIVRYLFLLILSYSHTVARMAEPVEPDRFPKVTVIIPAYNEGLVIRSSANSALQLDYPDFEVIVVDDGSSDDTRDIIEGMVAEAGGEKLRYLYQPNRGKAVALNHGIANARGELVLCMDADSILEPQTLRQAAKHFRNPAVGAVAGNVKVANRNNILTRLQALEYIQGLNLVRASQAALGRVTVIPGPVGMFRRRVLEQLGGYRDNTFAEDCEITLRVMLAGWQITYEDRAVAWTEAPETLSAFFKQRYRWSRGILQAVLRHKQQLFRPFPNPMNWLMLWYQVFEGTVLPAMNLAGVGLFLLAALSGSISSLIVLWWAQLTLLDMAVAFYCVAAERESLRLPLYAFVYRLYFIPYVDVMRFFSGLDELFSVRMAWMRLERFGRV